MQCHDDCCLLLFSVFNINAFVIADVNIWNEWRICRLQYSDSFPSAVFTMAHLIWAAFGLPRPRSLSQSVPDVCWLLPVISSPFFKGDHWLLSSSEMIFFSYSSGCATPSFYSTIQAIHFPSKDRGSSYLVLLLIIKNNFLEFKKNNSLVFC